MRELTSAKWLWKHFVWDKTCASSRSGGSSSTAASMYLQISIWQQSQACWSKSTFNVQVNGGTMEAGCEARASQSRQDLIAVSMYDIYSVGPSIRPMCVRYFFTMNYMIQVCSNFCWAREFIINICPDVIKKTHPLLSPVDARKGTIIKPGVRYKSGSVQ